MLQLQLKQSLCATESVLKLCIVLPFLSGCFCGRTGQVLFTLGPLPQLSTVSYKGTLTSVPSLAHQSIRLHRLVYAFTVFSAISSLSHFSPGLTKQIKCGTPRSSQSMTFLLSSQNLKIMHPVILKRDLKYFCIKKQVSCSKYSSEQLKV